MKRTYPVLFALALALCVMAGLVGTTSVSAREALPQNASLLATQNPVQLVVCDGGQHTPLYCAVKAHRKQVRDLRDAVTKERTKKFLLPLHYNKLTWKLEALKRQKLQAERQLRYAKRAPMATYYEQAHFTAIHIIRMSEGSWKCLAAIVPTEGGWADAQNWNNGGSGAFGHWQALPRSKIAPYGDPDTTMAQTKWAYAYSFRYGGPCGSLSFRLSHNYW